MLAMILMDCIAWARERYDTVVSIFISFRSMSGLRSRDFMWDFSNIMALEDLVVSFWSLFILFSSSYAKICI